MKKSVFYSLFFIFHFSLLTANAQVNLVPNPSFEDALASDPNCSIYEGSGALWLAHPWFKPTTGGTSLFRTCANLPNNSVPYNIKGYQYPRTGDNYAGGIWAGAGGGRQYLSVSLSANLQTGKTYCVRFYVSLADKSKYTLSSIQLCFSADTLTNSNPTVISNLFNHIPQLSNEWDNLITDTLNWTLLEWQYLAQGNERFITIGNFKPDSLSNLVLINNNATGGIYHYIDDVSVIDSSTPAYAGNDTLIALGDSVFIGRQPEIGLNDACVWYANGVPVDTVAGMWVSPTVTTIYILEQTLCGTQGYDTVVVTVVDFGVYTTINASACESYTLNNETYTSSGVYTQVFQSAAGNDSTVTLNLTVLSPSFVTITASACERYLLNGELYTTSGVYTQLLQNAVGCDSIITLDLTIFSLQNGTITDGITVSATQTGVNYQWIDCTDKVPVSGAVFQSFTPTENGSYAVVLSVGPCADTSACTTFSTIGLDENEPLKFSIFPNPAQNEVNVLITGIDKETEMSVCAITGQEIVKFSAIKSEEVFNIQISEWESGIYFCKIKYENNYIMKKFSVIK